MTCWLFRFSSWRLRKRYFGAYRGNVDICIYYERLRQLRPWSHISLRIYFFKPNGVVAPSIRIPEIYSIPWHLNLNQPPVLRHITMGTIASQITSLINVYSTVYSGADQRNHESSASLAFVWGIHRRPVNSLHKWPVTRKMFPFDDVIKQKGLLFVHDVHWKVCIPLKQSVFQFVRCLYCRFDVWRSMGIETNLLWLDRRYVNATQCGTCSNIHNELNLLPLCKICFFINFVW